MRALLLDPASHLDIARIRQLAAKTGLAPRALRQPLEAQVLRDTLDVQGVGEGLLLYTDILTQEQAQELDALLDDFDTPLDLVLELATDPRPLAQRLAEPLEGDSPSAAHYRQRGLLQRVWAEADGDTVAAAAGYALADAVRARHPELETLFPPEVVSQLKPDVPAEKPVKVSEKIEVEARSVSPDVDKGGDTAPIWRRSAEQKGRIRRRSPTSGGRAGKGWKPKS